MKKEYSITSLQKRILCVISIISFLFLCVMGKLFFVQIIQGKGLQIRAISQWTRDLSLSGLRGEILDRNGTVLASSYTSYNVYVRASNVKDAHAVASLLSEKLDVDYNTVLEKAQKTNISESLIKSQVDITVAKEILSAKINLIASALEAPS